MGDISNADGGCHLSVVALIEGSCWKFGRWRVEGERRNAESVVGERSRCRKIWPLHAAKRVASGRRRSSGSNLLDCCFYFISPYNAWQTGDSTRLESYPARLESGLVSESVFIFQK